MTKRNRLAMSAISAIALALPMTMATETSAAPASEQTTGAIARVEGGAVRGVVQGDVTVFRGIPFAAPPVGPLRWRAPQPVAAWTGVREAATDAHDCMQSPSRGDAAPLKAPLSEDCLYVNVFKPATARPGAGLPVIVWIHGGGFVNGGISPAVFDGDAFARSGVVMVSINYRLGRFGFFAHPGLTAENADGGRLANYGLMDQIAGLEWVKRNVAAFGGDPAKVTIFGESAGGMSVNFMLAAPGARGLFRGAIIQSGGGRGNLMGNRALAEDRPGLPSLTTIGLAYAKSQGIEGNGADALARLRALPAEAVSGNLSMWSMAENATTYGGPIVDGKVIPEAPSDMFQSGRQAPVPVMIGATSNDLGNAPGQTKAEALAGFGSGEAKARAIFDPAGDAPEARVRQRIGQNRTMIEPARFVAYEIGTHGQPTWLFRLSYVADSVRAKMPFGAPHASDVPYTMGTVDKRYGAATTPADIAMARTVNAYWVNFAKRLDPNGPGLPVWPKYVVAKDSVMDFASDGRAQFRKDPLKAELDLQLAAYLEGADKGQ